MDVFDQGSTKDIDIWIEDTLENRKRIRKALKEQGSGDFSSIETMDFIPGWTDFQLNMGLKLYIMTAVKGLEKIGFDECFNYTVVAEIEGIVVRFLHYNHLITCKKAAGRPQDLVDIEELEKIRKAGEGNNPLNSSPSIFNFPPCSLSLRQIRGILCHQRASNHYW